MSAQSARIRLLQNERHFGLNNGVLATAHKLPLCTPFRTLHTYPVQPVGRSRPLTFAQRQ